MTNPEKMMKDPETLKAIGTAIKGLGHMLNAMSRQPEIQKCLEDNGYSINEMKQLIAMIFKFGDFFSEED